MAALYFVAPIVLLIPINHKAQSTTPLPPQKKKGKKVGTLKGKGEVSITKIKDKEKLKKKKLSRKSLFNYSLYYI